ncbi:MAG: PEP-utilizing enzyme, partial [Gammaproteobacteria bacterium]
LSPLGITPQEINELEQGLKALTQHAFTRLENDILPLQQLHNRRLAITETLLEPLDKAILLLEDCKRFGTLAFSHAARAGFVAMSFLKSLVHANIISLPEKQAFLSSIKTVASQFEEDATQVIQGNLSPEEYCSCYGHLRPGTYDIMVEAYWENPQRYLFPKLKTDKQHTSSTFEFSKTTQQAITEELESFAPGLSFSAFNDYLARAIQARESVKFEFTRNLSCALDYFAEYGRICGFSRAEMSYLQIDELKQLKGGSLSLTSLSEIIQQRKKTALLTQMIELPQLILSESDFYCFERMLSQPNFITSKCVTAPLITWSENEYHNLQGNIILIPQADPGYDWLFAHNIAGLVTKYGGANSHMAIRAAEMALPAAIGVGDKLYEELSRANYLHLDCALQQIRGFS